MAWLGQLQQEELINSNVLTATYDDAMNAIANGDAVILFQGMFTIGHHSWKSILTRRPSCAPAHSRRWKPT